MSPAESLKTLAGLGGEAVPLHRFDEPEASAESLIRSWKAVFPDGALIYQSDNVAPGDFPLIGLSKARVYVLTAKNSQGQWVAVDGSALEFDELTLLKPERSKNQDLRGSASQLFLRMLGRRRGPLLEAGVATLVVNLLALVTSLYTMQVYDRVVPTGSQSTLWVLTVGVGFALVFDFVLKQIRSVLVDRASADLDVDVSKVLFMRALNIRLDARPKVVGTLAAQLKHFESVRQFMTSSSLFVLADAPFALLFIAFIAYLAPQLVWVPAVGLTTALVVGLAFGRPIERWVNAHMSESNQKTGLLVDSIDGAEAISASGAEWKVAERHAALTETVSQSDYKLRRINSWSSTASQSIQQIHYIALVALGAGLIVAGDLTMGALIAITIVSGRAFAPITQIPGLLVQWKHAKIALKALDNLMALPSTQALDRPIVPQTRAQELVVSELKFAYGENPQPAVDVAALRFGAGERVALVGSIGSGKSTLLRLLSGLYKPTSGHVRLDNIDIDQIARGYLSEQLGLLPQDVRMFQGTLRDNLTLGIPTPTDEALLAACQSAGLMPTVQSDPKGLDRPIFEGGRGLSGGQRQLVGLTRLLLAKPAFLLLDEPTASMDSSLERQVMGHLFADPKRGVIVVTHKLSLLPFVDRIVVMDRGKVLLDGPRDTVMEQLKQAAGAAS